MSEKPNIVTARLGGRERRILLCMWGLALAEEQGYDIAGLDLGQEAAAARKGQMRQMLELLWIGMLPFEESLTVQALGMEITLGDMEAVAAAFEQVVTRQLSGDVRAAVEEAQGKKSSPGQAPGQAPSRAKSGRTSAT